MDGPNDKKLVSFYFQRYIEEREKCGREEIMANFWGNYISLVAEKPEDHWLDGLCSCLPSSRQEIKSI
jgi:hypothetical protein